MEIDNRYITVVYKLYTVDEGVEDKEPDEVANERHPFQFISKLGVVLPAFEEAVVNLTRGDEFDFTIPYKDAYGEFKDELMIDVPISVFMPNGKLDTNHIYEGAIVAMQGEDGSRFNATIIEIKKDNVLVDLNHPRAGLDLHFVGRVVENRPATNQEISDLLNAMGGCGGCGGDCDGGCGGSCGGCH